MKWTYVFQTSNSAFYETYANTQIVSAVRTQLQSTDNQTKNLDKRIIFANLASRLHNMRTLQCHADLRKRQKIAGETYLCL